MARIVRMSGDVLPLLESRILAIEVGRSSLGRCPDKEIPVGELSLARDHVGTANAAIARQGDERRL